LQVRTWTIPIRKSASYRLRS